jgi:hypothetical protein
MKYRYFQFKFFTLKYTLFSTRSSLPYVKNGRHCTPKLSECNLDLSAYLGFFKFTFWLRGRE